MQVLLQFFQDDANGAYGLAHSNSIEKGFNAFFNEIGMFHDIMEHYFEGIHPSFSGEYAFNYAGEIAASGHTLWYVNGLGLYDRWKDLNSYQSMEDTVSRTVGLEDEICSGYVRDFGVELKTKVRNKYQPHPNYSQVPMYHWDYWVRLMENNSEVTGDAFERQAAFILRKSLSLSKLEALYGWGYYRAKRLFPLTDENTKTVQQMYNDLKKFTKYNDPKELTGIFRFFRADIKPGKKFSYSFKLIDNYYKEEHDIFDWRKTLRE